MAQTPTVASSAKVVRAISTEMPVLFALQAAITRGGGQKVRGRGVVFQIWLISRAFAPCSISMDMCAKLLKVIDNASTCKAGSDEVGDKDFVGVPDNI